MLLLSKKRIAFAGTKPLAASQPRDLCTGEMWCGICYIAHAPRLPFAWRRGAVLGRLVKLELSTETWMIMLRSCSPRTSIISRQRCPIYQSSEAPPALHICSEHQCRDPPPPPPASLCSSCWEGDVAAQSSSRPRYCEHIFCITVKTSGFSQEVAVAFWSILRSNQRQKAHLKSTTVYQTH